MGSVYRIIKVYLTSFLVFISNLKEICPWSCYSRNYSNNNFFCFMHRYKITELDTYTYSRICKSLNIGCIYVLPAKHSGA